MTQLPIEDYAMIGDSRSAALVSKDGSIDWLCWPRYDSRSVFARLLDVKRGGHFAIHPPDRYSVRRRYIDDTNVLETTFETDTGAVRLVDLMPALTEEEKRSRLLPLRQLLRRVEGIGGEVRMVATYAPRPDYARVEPRLDKRHGNIVWCAYGPEVWHLRSDLPIDIDRSTARADFTVRKGARHYFALSYETQSPAVLGNINDIADADIERSIRFWNEWSSHLTYEGPYRDEVLRSALVLKLLAYAPSGGIVAAPTTSLPEKIGGVRNWDYRYCWLRDASFTVSALYDCGFETEGGAFVDWLLYATRLTQPKLQILYDVFGESRLPERTLDHLEGYAGSKPVRTGNAASDQFQLDVYAQVLGALEESVDRGEELPRDTRRLVSRLADLVCRRWPEPDNGMWEKRSPRRHHVHGKVMAWAALDCACRIAEKRHIINDVERWRKAMAAIEADVVANGFNRKLNSFVAAYGSEELDASLLDLARVGFLEPADPRLAGTIDAVRRHLGRDELIYRYSGDTDDGLPPGEGAFLACSFWLAEALAIVKRFDEAHDVFEKAIRRANDVGLLSEEVDVDSGRLIGNFPQGLTHVALMNAALRLLT